MSETADDTTDGTGTTEADYRWRWLSTIWALVYGFGYPAVLATVGLDVSEVVMLALVTAWGGTVVYSYRAGEREGVERVTRRWRVGITLRPHRPTLRV